MFMLWCYLFIIQIFIIQTSEALVKVEDIDTTTMNRTSCVPVKSLENFMVQRGLGESRKIRKIHLQITGSGYIDLDLSIATAFRNEDYQSPIFHRCGNYFGKVENVVISSDCIDESNTEGHNGYAVYARFHGEIDPSLLVCRMDIVLHDKGDAQRKEIIHATIVITSVICTIIILSGIGVYAWFTWIKRDENGNEIVVEPNDECQEDDEPKVYLEENFATPAHSEAMVAELETSRSELVDDVFYDPSETTSHVNIGSLETCIN